MSSGDRFQQLCQAQIEGVATDEERAEFAAILRENESARRSYVEQMRMHAMLTWQHGRSQAALAELRLPQNVIRWSPRAWVAIAAAFVLLAGLAAWWQFASEPSGVNIEVMAANDVPFRAGDRMERKTIEIERGSLTFRVTSGAVVDVTGPAKLELLSPMRLRVARGSITADISEGQKGFVIETDQARVVDLGTRFGVTAGGTKGTDVVVFEGKVEVYDRTATAPNSQPKATLIEGEAIRLDLSHQSQRLAMIQLGKDARSLRGGLGLGIVGDVRDNMPESDSHRYYGLLPGGMGEGARVYTTGRSRTWHSMPGKPFPEELAGADVVCTFSYDRRATDLRITLQVDRPCDLFIMADARTPAPAWLEADFVNTGLRLRSGPWIPRGTSAEVAEMMAADESFYFPYAVWKRRVMAPGPVILGALQSNVSNVKPNMYGIALKELR